MSFLKLDGRPCVINHHSSLLAVILESQMIKFVLGFDSAEDFKTCDQHCVLLTLLFNIINPESLAFVTANFLDVVQVFQFGVVVEFDHLIVPHQVHLQGL